MEQRQKTATRNYILISLLGLLISVLGYVSKTNPVILLGAMAYAGGAVMALCK